MNNNPRLGAKIEIVLSLPAITSSTNYSNPNEIIQNHHLEINLLLICCIMRSFKKSWKAFLGEYLGSSE
ncbi:MAG: hypothetical protein CMP10_08035 [Zetaproteobacteria bacterium]|nr:hypothetical protein [Pseudobdellovibrionaceae bacterium]